MLVPDDCSILECLTGFQMITQHLLFPDGTLYIEDVDKQTIDRCLTHW